MARSKSPPSHNPEGNRPADQADTTEPMRGRGSFARAHGASENTLGGLDWLQNAAVGLQRSMDTMLQLQQQCIKTATQSSETLAEDLKELQQAKDPAELLSAQAALASQQLELLSGHFSSMLQQIYEAQLLWLGQFDEKQQSEGRQPSRASDNNALLVAWGKAQDDWLKLTRSWIDSINQGNAAH